MYKTLIADMIAKGYTRREDNGKSAKTLYISHHGVVNSAKPGKFRVIFDSSEEYIGTSLNNQLISGPELISKLFGRLKRFKAEQVAFIADFEAVFYQVRVLEVQRSFLRFLWWESGYILNPIEDHEMCVYLFGGISSSSCSNYALRQFSLDNEI